MGGVRGGGQIRTYRETAPWFGPFELAYLGSFADLPTSKNQKSGDLGVKNLEIDRRTSRQNQVNTGDNQKKVQFPPF